MDDTYKDSSGNSPPPPPMYTKEYDLQPPPEDIERDTNILIDTFLFNGQYGSSGSIAMPQPHRKASTLNLPQPLCLPQIAVAFDSPFSRGYNTALQDLGISQQTYLSFVDGLNVAMIASPPLQIVNTVGMALGFVPFWPFMVASTVLQTGAQVGMHIASKTLSDRYLRASNEKLFAPAGLRARLVRTPALRVLVGLQDASTPGPSKLDKFGRGVGDVVLHLPLPLPFLKKGIRMLMDKPPTVDPRIVDPVVRRLMMMQGHVLPVNLDVPPATPPEGILDKLSAYSVRKRTRKVDRKADLATARRQILAGMPVTAGEHHAGSSSSSSFFSNSARDQYRLRRKTYRMQRKVARGRDWKLRRKVENDDLREYHQNEQIVWLVLINEEQDKLIQGAEGADGPSNDVVFEDTVLEKSKKMYDEEMSSDSSDDSSSEDDEKRKASGSGKH